jgi:hypothetical protein
MIEKRYARLEEYEPLHDYYNLKDTEITVDRKETILNVQYNYSKKPIYIHFHLPEEINKIIHSFREDRVEIHLNLECIPTFPYNSPIWNLIEVRHNFHKNLLEYYQYIVDVANESNTRNWSCIYGFEKEILRFFVRINHFDYL